MVSAQASKSQETRAKLDHPIIDADGHTLELPPVLLDYVQKYGGTRIRDLYEEQLKPAQGGKLVRRLAERAPGGMGEPAPPWWFAPTKNTFDRATVTIPRLLNERMEELGIDYAVLYPTLGLGFDRIKDEEVRMVGCRAMNACVADLYRPYAHRMTPAAIVPKDTPQI